MKRMFRKNLPAPSAKSQQDPELASDFNPEATEKKIGIALFLGLLTGALFAFLVFLFSPDLRDYVYWLVPGEQSIRIDADTDGQKFAGELKRAQNRLTTKEKKLKSLIPKEPYLIVDTSGNQIFLMKNDQLMHRGVCSTGSYVLLRAAKNKQWIFRTPRGQFRVLNKMKRPVWYMPDWAFVEEGRPIPPRDSPLRFEAGVLGDYALALGDGYLIHGTLYKRFLGMPVTHGCVRLGDEDLEMVVKHMKTGSKVYIY